MGFIKKIFEGMLDEDVHKQFSRFSKGQFEKAYINIRKGPKNFKLKTSYEFASEIAGLIAQNAEGELEVTGQIIANYDFQKEPIPNLQSFKKKGKIYIGQIAGKFSNAQLRQVYEKFKSHNLLLNINSPNYSLKVGKSLPKPGKALKDNFCSATLPLSLLNEFAFDIKKEFKEAAISHVYIIKEIMIPEKYKNEPEMARIHGQRKGVLIRKLVIDGEKEEHSTDFVA
ncbi:hypothetical protein HY643_02935 [Candidatus Woesearchaeota archaeon]|nr:hypothetical protein [Candidatus Woesearchaeota archaeon]